LLAASLYGASIERPGGAEGETHGESDSIGLFGHRD
jgi:hypothetical protein